MKSRTELVELAKVNNQSTIKRLESEIALAMSKNLERVVCPCDLPEYERLKHEIVSAGFVTSWHEGSGRFHGPKMIVHL